MLGNTQSKFYDDKEELRIAKTKDMVI